MSRHPLIAKLILAAVTGLAACSNTFDFMEKELEGPVLYLGKDTTNRRDSIKTLFKDLSVTPTPLKFHITPAPVGSLLEITVTIEGGGGILKAGDNLVTLQVQGDFLTGAFPAQKNTLLNLSFLPDTKKGGALYKLIFAARSRYGFVSKIHVSLLTVSTYENLLPIAKLVITTTNSKYNYNLDASASFDQDRIYGGKPAVYKYTIAGTSSGAPYLHQFSVTLNKIPYSFPNTGIFTVSLEVQDNDGGKSAPLEQKITIQE